MMTGNGTYHGDLITTVSIFIAMPVGAAFNIRGVGGVLMGESSFLFIFIRVGKSNYGFTPNYF